MPFAFLKGGLYSLLGSSLSATMIISWQRFWHLNLFICSFINHILKIWWFACLMVQTSNCSWQILYHSQTIELLNHGAVSVFFIIHWFSICLRVIAVFFRNVNSLFLNPFILGRWEAGYKSVKRKKWPSNIATWIPWSSSAWDFRLMLCVISYRIRISNVDVYIYFYPSLPYSLMRKMSLC